jgi:hypothetical protein
MSLRPEDFQLGAFFIQEIDMKKSDVLAKITRAHMEIAIRANKKNHGTGFLTCDCTLDDAHKCLAQLMREDTFYIDLTDNKVYCEPCWAARPTEEHDDIRFQSTISTNAPRRETGFVLAELVIVIGIIVVLMAVALPKYIQTLHPADPGITTFHKTAHCLSWDQQGYTHFHCQKVGESWRT